jgi:glutamate carboxypeptidase
VTVHAGLLAALRPRLADMTAQLADLVGHESPSDDLELLGKCAARVGALGAQLLGGPPAEVNVGGRVHLLWRIGACSPASVVLIGHYDTVWPRRTLERWPFGVDGAGRASGPGAFDMKAGIVQLFHALSVLELDSPDPGVAVLLTADEELGSQTSRQLVEDTARGARAALVLEPSARGALKVARKGTSMYEIHALGRSAHAGLEPEKGVNAGVELAHQILEMGRLGRPELGTTVTPTVMAAGTTTNSVPASGVLHVDVRATARDEQARVDEAIRALSAVLPGSRLQVEGGINRPPMEESASRGLFTRARSVAERMGLPALRGEAVGGASDGNFTAGIGVPTLDGLGADGDGAHAEGEYVVVDAMPERAGLVAGLVAELLADG